MSGKGYVIVIRHCEESYDKMIHAQYTDMDIIYVDTAEDARLKAKELSMHEDFAAKHIKDLVLQFENLEFKMEDLHFNMKLEENTVKPINFNMPKANKQSFNRKRLISHRRK